MARRNARSASSASKSERTGRPGRSSARSGGRSSGGSRRSGRARAEEEAEEEEDVEEEAEEEAEPEDAEADEGNDEDLDDDGDDDGGEEDDEDEGGRRSSRRGGKSGSKQSGKKGSASKASREPREPREPRERAASEPVTPGKAIALTVFLGLFGAGRFVMGHTGAGFAQVGLTVLVLLGLLLPPSLLDIPQGFWFAMPYLALVGNLTFLLHDLLLLGTGLMKDGRGRPILPPPPEGTVSKHQTRDRTYQMSLFAGMFGVGRFYLGDMVRGGIHLGLTVVGLILLLVGMPSWVGMRDYRVAGHLHFEEAEDPGTGNRALIHHITVEVFPQDTPLEELETARAEKADATETYFFRIAELRREERLPIPYVPPHFVPEDELLHVDDDARGALVERPREELAAVLDGFAIYPDEHITIRRIHDASSVTASEARLRAERRKAENRVWRGYVEGRRDEEGRVGKSVLQAMMDMYERPPLHMRRPALGIAGAVLLLASLLMWALDLISFGGGTVKTIKGVPLGFSEVHPRFNEKNREATRHFEIGVVMFVGAFFCFAATVYTGWPNAHGQPSLLEGVQVGFFVSLLLVLLFGGFGGYHLFAGERLQGEIRDEKLALMRQLDKHERDAQQGGSKKGAPPAPARSGKTRKSAEAAPVKKAAGVKKATATKAPPPEEEGEEEAAPKKKGARPRRRRRM